MAVFKAWRLNEGPLGPEPSPVGILDLFEHEGAVEHAAEHHIFISKHLLRTQKKRNPL